MVLVDDDVTNSEVASRGMYVIEGFPSVTREDGIAVVVVEEVSILGGGLDVLGRLVVVDIGELDDAGVLDCIAGDEVVSGVSKLVEFGVTLGSRTHPSGVVMGTQSVG